MRSVLFLSFALPILHAVIATDTSPRLFHARDLLLDKRDLCSENGQVDCYNNCSPPDAVCCSDGSGTYCLAGERCVSDGCCADGETCSGGGGTITDDWLTDTGSYPTATESTAPRTTPNAQTTATHAQTIGAANGNTQGGGIGQNTETQNANTQATPAAATKTVTAPTGNAQNTGSGPTTTLVVSSGSSRNAITKLAVVVLAAGQVMLGW